MLEIVCCDGCDTEESMLMLRGDADEVLALLTLMGDVGGYAKPPGIVAVAVTIVRSLGGGDLTTSSGCILRSLGWCTQYSNMNAMSLHTSSARVLKSPYLRDTKTSGQFERCVRMINSCSPHI